MKPLHYHCAIPPSHSRDAIPSRTELAAALVRTVRFKARINGELLLRIELRTGPYQRPVLPLAPQKRSRTWIRTRIVRIQSPAGYRYPILESQYGGSNSDHRITKPMHYHYAILAQRVEELNPLLRVLEALTQSSAISSPAVQDGGIEPPSPRWQRGVRPLN